MCRGPKCFEEHRKIFKCPLINKNIIPIDKLGFEFFVQGLLLTFPVSRILVSIFKLIKN
jgi:hypothetical protein